MLGRTEPTRTQRQQIIPGYSLGGPVAAAWRLAQQVPFDRLKLAPSLAILALHVQPRWLSVFACLQRPSESRLHGTDR